MPPLPDCVYMPGYMLLFLPYCCMRNSFVDPAGCRSKCLQEFAGKQALLESAPALTVEPSAPERASLDQLACEVLEYHCSMPPQRAEEYRV
jgi:hypothetical protein